RPAESGQDLSRPGPRTRHTSGSRRLLLRSSVVVDGLVPVRVEKPSTAEEVAGLLRAAAEAGEAIVPVGGGRALGFGNPLERFDVALEMLGLNRVIEMSQGDMTVSVEAGVTVEELNAELAKVGQFVPIDPFNAPGHTVGGVLAAGLSGPLRMRYGSPRGFVIGLRGALPGGRLASSGGGGGEEGGGAGPQQRDPGGAGPGGGRPGGPGEW